MEGFFLLTKEEKLILLFLNNHNDGQCRSEDLLFAIFIQDYSEEYIDKQYIIRDAINSCIERNFITYDDNPNYCIHITETGRKELLI